MNSVISVRQQFATVLLGQKNIFPSAHSFASLLTEPGRTSGRMVNLPLILGHIVVNSVISARQQFATVLLGQKRFVHKAQSFAPAH